MSTATFERYDTEFQEIIQQIEQSFVVNVDSKNDSHHNYTNNLIQQGHDLLKQMAVEARSVPTDSKANNNTNNNERIKNELLNKVRTFKSQLVTLETKLSSQSLFGNNNNTATNNNSKQYEQNKMKLQQSENMLQMQNDTLERAKRSILETEQVALEINDELVLNRQTLLSSQNRIQTMSNMTNNAKRILSNMNQRHIQQKLILYTITTILILAFFFLLYTMWG
jgi:hypothetical protein